MPLIRPIAPHEWPAYREARLRSLLDSPDAFGSTHALEAARPDSLWSSRLEAAAQSGKDLPLFALEGDAPCGLLWCKIAADDPALADLFQMWVAPEQRGRGLGRALLREAIAWARASGVRRLRLGVTVGDSPATRLYRAHGFVPVGAPEALREGSPLRAQAMELAIGTSRPAGLVIRPATKRDREPIRRVHFGAFPGDESPLVVALAESLLVLRSDPSTISLVAECEDGIIGHVAFSPVTSDEDSGWLGYLLAPLGVQDGHQRKGVGTALVEKGLEAIASTPAQAVLVYGNPKVYGRFGFTADGASRYVPPFELSHPYGWQVRERQRANADAPSRHLSVVPPLRDPALW